MTVESDVIELRAAVVRLQARLYDLEEGLLVVRHNPPAKLVEGMIRVADGTDWDPGSGAGIYLYLGSVWTKL